MEGELVPRPERGRTFAGSRRIRLADRDGRGRLRLDAIARFLQDIAIDDVSETGWGLPDHIWFVRRIRVDVVAPFLDDERVDLVTWSSGLAALAAGRRWSLRGDRGGRAEVDSVWIHLGADGRPARIENFGVYAEAGGGRRVSTRSRLPHPPAGAARVAWPLRATDVDLHGHVNNTVHWQAIEHLLLASGPDPGRPLRAHLDYLDPLDLGEEVELAASSASGRLHVGFVAGARVKALATVEALT
ncbi:MAG: acyl-ACP thioesterase domain-containing protein [Chloroflexota bacterium]